MLKVDITCHLGDFTLSAAFNAGAGTTVLYGPSGSGKTSLVNAVAGVIRPASGHVTWDGTALFDSRSNCNVPVHKRRMGYVFQDARLFPHLDVAGNLDYAARFAAAPADRAERARLIDILGIGALMTRRPAALSGGEKQRVALGRALMSAPRMLLLDEPLAALDGPRKSDILPYLDALRAQTGVPMLYVTHDMNEIVRLADTLVIVKDGACVVQGRAEDVLSDPALVPLVGVQDAGALVTARLAEHTGDGLSVLALSAGRILVPQVDLPVGTQVRLRLRAQDVIVSLAPPVGLSSQNALRAVVSDVRKGDGPGVAVALRSGEDRLLARITARALADLGLEQGQEVWAILKATAVPRAAIAKGR